MEATKKIFVSYNLRHIYGEDHEYHPNEWSFEKNQFCPRCETSEIFYKLVSGLGEKWLDTRTLEHAEALGYEVVKLRSWTGERFSGGRQRYVYRDWLIREVPHPYKPHYEIYDPHPNTWVQETVDSRLMICLDSNGFDQVATLDDYDLKDCADTLEDAVNMIDNILTKERVCS
tara:strand:- start:571 stop:1089 length:519 start_codon:yes stop_codon:yes gene_type:complete